MLQLRVSFLEDKDAMPCLLPLPNSLPPPLLPTSPLRPTCPLPPPPSPPICLSAFNPPNHSPSFLPTTLDPTLTTLRFIRPFSFPLPPSFCLHLLDHFGFPAPFLRARCPSHLRRRPCHLLPLFPPSFLLALPLPSRPTPYLPASCFLLGKPFLPPALPP